MQTDVVSLAESTAHSLILLPPKGSEEEQVTSFLLLLLFWTEAKALFGLILQVHLHSLPFPSICKLHCLSDASAFFMSCHIV